MQYLRWAMAVATAGGSAGCTAPRGPLVVGSDDPAINVPAVAEAARTGNRRSTAALIGELRDPEPATRMFAIGALRRLTGQDLGYVYYQPVKQREPAVLRWEAWFAASTRPSTWPTTVADGGVR